jgi:RimJ/RimL family protein N-acetyltransferase
MWFQKKTNTPFQPQPFGPYLIKEVIPQDWHAFRAFYLRALKMHPGCSSESYEEKKSETSEQWQRLLAQSWEDPRSLIVGIIHKPTGSFVGVVRIAGNSESKLSHEAHIRAFYLAEEHYDVKLMAHIWQSIFKHLTQFTDIQKLKTAVLTTDKPMIMKFNELGFARYGYDETYLKVGRKYLDALLMFKRL